MKQTEEHKLLTQREQILLRPETSLGAMANKAKWSIVFDDGVLKVKSLEYSSPQVKLIEEPIVNSIDEFVRTAKTPRPWGKLTNIAITVQEDGYFAIEDNGGISTEKHSSGMSIVETIFFHLNSSSNYDDTEDRFTVGKNGHGVKLSSIFSKWSRVTTADGSYEIVHESKNNMSELNEVSRKKSKKTFTKFESQMDLEKLGTSDISYTTIKYIESICIASAAANPGLKISLNGEEFSFTSYKNYIDTFDRDEIVFESNDHWEYAVIPLTDTKELEELGGQHFGIVNGAVCNEGTVKKMLFGWTYEKLRDYFKSKEFKKIEGENFDVTSQAVISKCMILSNIKINQPLYDSQAKDELVSDIRVRDTKGTLRWRKFTTDKQLAESSLADMLKDWYIQKKNSEEASAVRKQSRELKKKSAKSLRKLIDATGKTKKQRANSTLFIFEGDSASKSFRTTRDPKTQGSLALRGKCKNSFSMSTLKLIQNEEFQNIIIAFGLDPQNPDDLSKLRYDKLAIMTDQDYDGFSICGQLLTFFAVHFPETLRQGKIYRVQTPLWVSKKAKQRKYFYSQEEFNAANLPNTWTSKYMKGLGSLTKDIYADILKNPMMEQFIMDDDAINKIRDWMSGSSAKRKAYLSGQAS